MEAVTVRTRKFMRNPLLARKQMVVDVVHPNQPNVSKATLQEKLAQLYKVRDKNCIMLFGFRTAFGGGKSTGFGLIYESVEDVKKFEPRYRLARVGMVPKAEAKRGKYKENKGKIKRTWGTGRRMANHKAKRGAE